MTAQWKDPAFAGVRSREAAQLIITVCQARRHAPARLRRSGDSGFAAHRVAGLRSYSASWVCRAGPPILRKWRWPVVPMAAAAVASTQITPSDSPWSIRGRRFRPGGGSGGGYRGGGFSVGGIGLSFLVGGATTTRSLGSSTSLVDPASGAVIWSGARPLATTT